MASRAIKIASGILVTLILGAVALLVLAPKATNTDNLVPVRDQSKLVSAHSHKEGDGPVQVVEFGDFQCPACAAAYPAVQQLLQTDKPDITFYFRNYPLTQIHPNASEAAEAAEAAGAQGEYWQMHDKLYENASRWRDLKSPTSTFVSYARSLGLSAPTFEHALQSQQYQGVIAGDIADGNALGVDATPTFFIGGKMYTGNFDFVSLNRAIQIQLK
ncbi:MAG TPA: thioredoxin domain-containing protein [Candidatus Saccharimonadia bacterium]|nr:thioredoxin domain-containing protein [Candidatus Saccharimonadia bacterium]